MRWSLATLALLMVAMLPGSATAYVGPGAGISLIGSTIGLLIALGMALGFAVLWPLRALFRSRKQPVLSPSGEEPPLNGTP